MVRGFEASDAHHSHAPLSGLFKKVFDCAGIDLKYCETVILILLINYNKYMKLYICFIYKYIFKNLR